MGVTVVLTWPVWAINKLAKSRLLPPVLDLSNVLHFEPEPFIKKVDFWGTAVYQRIGLSVQ